MVVTTKSQLLLSAAGAGCSVVSVSGGVDSQHPHALMGTSTFQIKSVLRTICRSTLPWIVIEGLMLGTAE